MFLSLVAATSWIDVSIPGFFGVLMLACPHWVIKSTGSAEKDMAKRAWARKGGAILLVVAAIYWVTSTVGS